MVNQHKVLIFHALNYLYLKPYRYTYIGMPIILSDISFEYSAIYLNNMLYAYQNNQGLKYPYEDIYNDCNKNVLYHYFNPLKCRKLYSFIYCSESCLFLNSHNEDTRTSLKEELTADITYI